MSWCEHPQLRIKMELVPILSTIILVGTVATFILAVFAYILYKVRERRTRNAAGRQSQYTGARRTQIAPPTPVGAHIGQPMSASMYIAPTTSLPPQGPVIEVEHMREATPPVGGWQQPPNVEHAVAATSSFDRADESVDRRPSQHTARPQPQEIIEPRQLEREALHQPSSLFWEYTDDGFVPVDPTRSGRRGAAQAGQFGTAEDEEGFAWL
jgi:hypothetical protein